LYTPSFLTGRSNHSLQIGLPGGKFFDEPVQQGQFLFAQQHYVCRFVELPNNWIARNNHIKYSTGYDRRFAEAIIC
jgi:hypothetical protein